MHRPEQVHQPRQPVSLQQDASRSHPDKFLPMHELQRQGIEVAKDDGKHLGRPQVEFPENWMASYDSWKNGRITARAAMKEMNLKKDSFYRLVKKYEQS